MPDKKTLVKFNIQNAKFALQSGESWAVPVPFGTSQKISLEANSSTKQIFGDGRIIASIVNDKGKTGTLTLNNISEDYEIAMGRKMRLQQGIADIKTLKQVPHCIYFETCGFDEDGGFPVAKTWLYNVTSSRPSENYDQTTDDINESTFDIPLEIRGTLLQNSQGEPYKDDQGNLYYAYQVTVTPGDIGYDTFGDTVAIPQAE